MATIKFKKVKCKNFLSVGDNWLEYKLDHYGSTGLVGKNGAGKSLLLDALCFSLYGKSYRNCNKPLLINSINERDSVVEIEFETMGKSYKIVRGQKPNIFEIYQDGVLLNQDAKAKDYQHFLEKNILKMNFKSFTQIIVLGSTNYTPFMELSAADRRAVIEDLLDIHIFSDMRTVLKEYTSDNNHQMQQHESKIRSLQEKIDLQQDNIDKIKAKANEKTEDKKKYLQQLLDEMDALEKEIDNQNEESKNLLESISNKFTNKQQEIDEIKQCQSVLVSKTEDCQTTIDFYQKNNTCPTCKQSIRKEEVQELLDEAQNKKNELQEAVGELQGMLTEALKIHDEFTKAMQEYDQYSLEIREKGGKKHQLMRQILDVEKEIDSIENENGDDSEYQQNLETFQKEFEVLEKESMDLASYKKLLKTAEILLKDNGIKSKIIKEYLPQMNQLINKYLKALDFFVEFNLDENFKETVKSRFRDVFSYESFSEGQKFRINIAILFAWRDIARLKNSSHTNILVLDEVFDSSLDAEGVDDFIKLLRAVTEDNVHVMVISHRGDTMIDKFDRVANLSMERGFTQMRMS